MEVHWFKSHEDGTHRLKGRETREKTAKRREKNHHGGGGFTPSLLPMADPPEVIIQGRWGIPGDLHDGGVVPTLLDHWSCPALGEYFI